MPRTPNFDGVPGFSSMFKGGEVAATKIGALPKGQLRDWVDSVI